MSTSKNSNAAYGTGNLNSSLRGPRGAGGHGPSSGVAGAKLGLNGMLVLSKRPRAASGSKLSVPLPVNLPSMKKEHAGNDPNTQLVPSGAGAGTWKAGEEPGGAGSLDVATRSSSLTAGSVWSQPAPAPAPAPITYSHHRGITERRLNQEEFPSLAQASTAQAAAPVATKPVKPSYEHPQEHRSWADDERAPPAGPRSGGYEWNGPTVDRHVEEDRAWAERPEYGKGWDRFGGPPLASRPADAEPSGAHHGPPAPRHGSYEDDAYGRRNPGSGGYGFDSYGYGGPGSGRFPPEGPGYRGRGAMGFGPPPPPPHYDSSGREQFDPMFPQHPARPIGKGPAAPVEEEDDPERRAFDEELARVAADMGKRKQLEEQRSNSVAEKRSNSVAEKRSLPQEQEDPSSQMYRDSRTVPNDTEPVTRHAPPANTRMGPPGRFADDDSRGSGSSWRAADKVQGPRTVVDLNRAGLGPGGVAAPPPPPPRSAWREASKPKESDGEEGPPSLDAVAGPTLLQRGTQPPPPPARHTSEQQGVDAYGRAPPPRPGVHSNGLPLPPPLPGPPNLPTPTSPGPVAVGGLPPRGHQASQSLLPTPAMVVPVPHSIQQQQQQILLGSAGKAAAIFGSFEEEELESLARGQQQAQHAHQQAQYTRQAQQQAQQQQHVQQEAIEQLPSKPWRPAEGFTPTLLTNTVRQQHTAVTSEQATAVLPPPPPPPPPGPAPASDVAAISGRDLRPVREPREPRSGRGGRGEGETGGRGGRSARVASGGRGRGEAGAPVPSTWDEPGNVSTAERTPRGSRTARGPPAEGMVADTSRRDSGRDSGRGPGRGTGAGRNGPGRVMYPRETLPVALSAAAEVLASTEESDSPLEPQLKRGRSGAGTVPTQVSGRGPKPGRGGARGSEHQQHPSNNNSPWAAATTGSGPTSTAPPLASALATVAVSPLDPVVDATLTSSAKPLLPINLGLGVSPAKQLPGNFDRSIGPSRPAAPAPVMPQLPADLDLGTGSLVQKGPVGGVPTGPIGFSVAQRAGVVGPVGPAPFYSGVPSAMGGGGAGGGLWDASNSPTLGFNGPGVQPYYPSGAPGSLFTNTAGAPGSQQGPGGVQGGALAPPRVGGGGSLLGSYGGGAFGAAGSQALLPPPPGGLAGPRPGMFGMPATPFLFTDKQPDWSTGRIVAGGPQSPGAMGGSRLGELGASSSLPFAVATTPGGTRVEGGGGLAGVNSFSQGTHAQSSHSLNMPPMPAALIGGPAGGYAPQLPRSLIGQPPNAAVAGARGYQGVPYGVPAHHPGQGQGQQMRGRGPSLVDPTSNLPDELFGSAEARASLPFDAPHGHPQQQQQQQGRPMMATRQAQGPPVTHHPGPRADSGRGRGGQRGGRAPAGPAHPSAPGPHAGAAHAAPTGGTPSVGMAASMPGHGGRGFAGRNGRGGGQGVEVAGRGSAPGPPNLVNGSAVAVQAASRVEHAVDAEASGPAGGEAGGRGGAAARGGRRGGAANAGRGAGRAAGRGSGGGGCPPVTGTGAPGASEGEAAVRGPQAAAAIGGKNRGRGPPRQGGPHPGNAHSTGAGGSGGPAPAPMPHAPAPAALTA